MKKNTYPHNSFKKRVIIKYYIEDQYQRPKKDILMNFKLAYELLTLNVSFHDIFSYSF